MNFSDIKDSISPKIKEEFWMMVRNNIKTLKDLTLWWNICYDFKNQILLNYQEKEFLKEAAELLPINLDENSWCEWTKAISKITNRVGKELYMPLRIAITGRSEGPELKYFLPLIGRKEILNRILLSDVK